MTTPQLTEAQRRVRDFLLSREEAPDDGLTDVQRRVRDEILSGNLAPETPALPPDTGPGAPPGPAIPGGDSIRLRTPRERQGFVRPDIGEFIREPQGKGLQRRIPQFGPIPEAAMDIGGSLFDFVAEGLTTSFSTPLDDPRRARSFPEMVEGFRERPWWQQLLFGSIFDPTLAVDPSIISRIPGPRTAFAAPDAGDIENLLPPGPRQVRGGIEQPQTGGAVQSSMGIGEQAPQGQLFPESPTQAQRQPLADPEQLQAQAARREEIEQGQQELFPTPEEQSPLEQARLELDQAQANLEAELTPGQRAPRFGTPERAAFDAERRQRAAEGQRIIPKRQRVREARQRVRDARENLRVQENALATQQMNIRDAVDLTRREGPELPTQTGGVIPPISPSGEVMEGGLGDVLRMFREFLQNPARADEWKQTLLERSRVLGERSRNLQDRMNLLISQGVEAETAIAQARRELSGQLPTVETPLHQLASQPVRDALFQEVYAQLADEPLEMVATAEALANALAGRAIPRTPGIRGGSAYTRLLRVFGEDLTQALNQQRSLEDIIALQTRTQNLGLTGFQGSRSPFIEYPSTQTFGSPETARLLPDEEALGSVQQPLRPEPPMAPFLERPPDLRPLSQREIDLQRFREQTGEATPPLGPSMRTPIPDEPLLRTPEQPLMPEEPGAPFAERPPDVRTQAQKELDLQIFREVTGEADAPIGPTDPQARAMLDLPPDDVVKQIRMIPDEASNRMLNWARALGLTVYDFANLMRSNIATIDLSYLRQQALLIPGNPVQFAQSFPDALRAIWSADYAKSIDNWIKTDPDMRYYDLIARESGGDFLRPLDGGTAKAWERAEDFIILRGRGGRPLERLANRIPWINISARAYITGINSMNWRIFKGHMKMLHRQNEQIASGMIKLKPGEVFDFQKEVRDFSRMLAEMSGRGPLGPLKELSPALNAGFFSVRHNIGRFISPRHMFQPGISRNTRRAAWKNFMTAIGTYSSIILAGKQMGLWDVETDPRSSDFMKIRIGNTRIDIWGGYQQYVVLYGRLLPVVGGIKSTQTGEISEYDPVTGVQRFLRFKAAPAVSQVLMAWTGKDFIGRDIDRTNFQFWLRQNTAIAVQDVFEAYEEHGLLGLAFGVGGALGAGIQVHEEAIPEHFRHLPPSVLREMGYDVPDRGGQGTLDPLRNFPEDLQRQFR